MEEKSEITPKYRCNNIYARPTIERNLHPNLD